MNDTHLIISTSNDLLRIAASHIIYIQADGNYCNIFQTGGEMKTVTLQLGQIIHMIDKLSWKFVRIGKSLIVNRRYVYYIQATKKQIILVDSQFNRYDLQASKEALTELKELIEKEER